MQHEVLHCRPGTVPNSALRAVPVLRRIISLRSCCTAPGTREMSVSTNPIPHDGTDAQARPVFAQERRVLGIAASTWPGIIAPVVIGILILAAWEVTVRVKGIPPYILP